MFDTPNTILPGAPWIYLKLYATDQVIERLLRTGALRWALASLVTGGPAVDWFFVRYRDPDAHLRLRLRRCDEMSTPLNFAEVVVATARANGIQRVTVDTYVRELHRYGGAECIDAAEHAFCLDTAFVCALLESPEWSSPDTVWLAVVTGIMQVLDAFGYAGEGRLALVMSAANAFANEFQIGTTQERQIGMLFRKRRTTMQRAVSERTSSFAGSEAIADALAKRRTALNQYAQLLAANALSQNDLDRVVQSMIHMFCNRLFADRQRMNEFIALDFLRRTLAIEAARQQAAADLHA